jgi:putative CocE/NonD family hydrolase
MINKNIFKILTLSLFIIILTIPWMAFAQEGQKKSDSNNMIITTEMISMSDGIKLATDIYLPAKDGKYPAILVRTPYDKKHIKEGALWFIENGYVVIAQDCRGKFLSEGSFYPFKNERADGQVTVDWIRTQPWTNGKIGGWGGSYVGYTQWAVSDLLDVITPELTSADIHGLLYSGGMFSLATAFNWGLVVDAQTVNPVPPEKILASYTILPLSVADDSTTKDIAFIDDWLAHPSYDLYWQHMDHQKIASAPVLSIAGWYDIFLMPQIYDFQALDPAVQAKSHLIVGPWCHGAQAYKNEYGGSERTGHKRELMRRFVNQQLKNIEFDLSDMVFQDKKYNLFIMERNEYYGADVWPPEATVFTDYYIGPDQYLSPKKLKKEGKLGYPYDPRNPYPNKGGTFLGVGVAAALQNDNLSRTDQLMFETPVLESPLILLGPVSATLYLSSDVPSTDFVVCLQDVFPDGNIFNIQEGGKRVDIKPGINEVKISVWPTGYQINPEHKLRVVISSSWFPRFDRNLNSGEPIFSAKTINIANQTIYYGKNPSMITLPILNIE